MTWMVPLALAVGFVAGVLASYLLFPPMQKDEWE